MEKIDESHNYMTVPAALKELEKIEMIKSSDNTYRIDHAVSATQKAILKAFGMTDANVQYRASEEEKIQIPNGTNSRRGRKTKRTG